MATITRAGAALSCIVAIMSPGSAGAAPAKAVGAGLNVTQVAIVGGRLVVAGTADVPNRVVRLQFAGVNTTRKAAANRAFRFSLNAIPTTCRVVASTRFGSLPLVVSNCSTQAGPRGPGGPAGAFADVQRVVKSCVEESDYVPSGSNFVCQAFCPAGYVAVNNRGRRALVEKDTDDLTGLEDMTPTISSDVAPEPRVLISVTVSPQSVLTYDVHLSMYCEPLIGTPVP